MGSPNFLSSEVGILVPKQLQNFVDKHRYLAMFLKPGFINAPPLFLPAPLNIFLLHSLTPHEILIQ